LYDLIKPHVTELIVCNPRRSALLKEGSKSDRIDARKLVELLRSNMLRSVYHGENGVRTLKELARSYLTISKDLGRVMSRVKAIYRSWGIPCVGKQIYAPRYRSEWLGKIQEAGVRRRAEFYYQQFDAFRALRQEVRRERLAEAQKHHSRNRASCDWLARVAGQSRVCLDGVHLSGPLDRPALGFHHARARFQERSHFFQLLV
jgi:hypothetical protein